MRNDLIPSETFVYRGAKIPLKIFEDYKNINNYNKGIQVNQFGKDKKRLILNGLVSTTLKKEQAFKFVFKGLSKDDVPVLYQINNLRKDGRCYFKLDSEEYSLFPNEQEVLLSNGSSFEIIEISE